MTSDLTAKKDQARIEYQRQVHDDVGYNVGTQAHNRSRTRIPGLGEIENIDSIHFLCVFARRPTEISILPFPALQNSGVGEHGFKLAELMDGGFLSINMWQAKVGNLSCRSLRAVMDLSAQNDSGADIPADVDKNKVLRGLRCAAIMLAKSCQVGIVLDDDHAVDNLAKHRA